MPSVTCPDCKNKLLAVPDNYHGTVQCDKCAKIIKIVTRNGIASEVRISNKINLEIPDGLPEDLKSIISEAMSCYEVGSNAATAVLSGLFIEGLLIKAGVLGKNLINMITSAHENKVISDFGFHLAQASRMIRNIGAHYSEKLAGLMESDARLALEIARKLAADVMESGSLIGTKI